MGELIYVHKDLSRKSEGKGLLKIKMADLKQSIREN